MRPLPSRSLSPSSILVAPLSLSPRESSLTLCLSEGALSEDLAQQLLVSVTGMTRPLCCPPRPHQLEPFLCPLPLWLWPPRGLRPPPGLRLHALCFLLPGTRSHTTVESQMVTQFAFSVRPSLATLSNSTSHPTPRCPLFSPALSSSVALTTL